MIDPNNVPPIGSNELSSRYVFARSHIRRSDLTLKLDAFMPDPHAELSVTRHLSATEEEIWSDGQRVAAVRNKPLRGRGDIGTADCIAQNLGVNPTPLPDNPNHADVIQWPADKNARKMIALRLAAASKFVAPPTT